MPGASMKQVNEGPMPITTPFTKKQAYLVHDNLLYRIHAPIIFLGRHPNNNLILTYPTVSRFHARIKFENDQFVLYDYGSKYGTFINDKQINRQELTSGDIIKLADVEILFIDESKGLQLELEKATGDLSE